MTFTNRQLVILCLACMAAGWWLSSSPASPINPTPHPDRPVIRWIARAAKTFLWVALVAEKPPEDVQYVHTRVGDDGQPLLDHSRGW